MCVYMCIYSVCKLFYMHVHVCVLRIRTYYLVATDKFCAVTYRQPLQSYDILNFLTWYIPVTYICTYIAPMHTCHVIIFRKFLQKVTIFKYSLCILGFPIKIRKCFFFAVSVLFAQNNLQCEATNANLSLNCFLYLISARFLIRVNIQKSVT